MRHGKRAQRFCSMRLATVLTSSYLVRISKRESPISTKPAGFSWLRMWVMRSTGAVLGTRGKGLLMSSPQVPRTAPVERITHILSHENPAVFVEMGDSRFEILTKYDLVSTVASLMEQKR